jgi:hypothetical protein
LRAAPLDKVLATTTDRRRALATVRRRTQGSVDPASPSVERRQRRSIAATLLPFVGELERPTLTARPRGSRSGACASSELGISTGSERAAERRTAAAAAAASERELLEALPRLLAPAELLQVREELEAAAAAAGCELPPFELRELARIYPYDVAPWLDVVASRLGGVQ